MKISKLAAFITFCLVLTGCDTLVIQDYPSYPYDRYSHLRSHRPVVIVDQGHYRKPHNKYHRRGYKKFDNTWDRPSIIINQHTHRKPRYQYERRHHGRFDNHRYDDDR